MILFEPTTIIVCAVLILMGIATPFVSIFFRKVRHIDEPTESTCPPVSIILYAHDNARDLERHLPAILEQDYPSPFEVIVVEGKSEDDTDDVLKKLKHQYANLYTTFVPDSARYMSRQKLAITLGVKAAKNEWLLLTEPTCHPASHQWLLTMTRFCQPSTELVVGYVTFNDEASDYQHFERLLRQRYLLREAQHGHPYRTEPGNLMFRKSTFLEGRSFDGNLKFIRGEYDFIVNKFATATNTATATHSSSWIIDDAPTHKQWMNYHLFYMETRKHLRNSLRHRLPIFIDHIAIHLPIILSLIVSLLITIFSFWKGILEETFGIAVLSSVVISLLLTYILRTTIARRSMTRFGDTVPAWKVYPYEISIVWRFLYYKLRHRMADRYDFISHKV